MKIFLLRHGEALDRDEAKKNGVEDAQRPLISKGKSRTKKIVKFLKGTIGRTDLLVSSPYLRAQQTAAIAMQTIRFDNYLESIELVPEAPPAAFVKWLAKEAQNVTSVFVVGHEPQLSLFASYILSGRQDSMILLKKSGIICIEVESFDSLTPKSTSLRWHLDPKMI